MIKLLQQSGERI